MKQTILIRLFADLDGETLELFGYISGMERAEFSARFPGVNGRKYDGRRMQVAKTADGRLFPVTRAIEFKKTSKVKRCDARCLNALGPNCECQCGGVNHGRGDAGAQWSLLDAPGPSIIRAGFFDDSNARIEETAADFALDFMGGSLDLDGEQMDLSGIVGGSESPRVANPKQTTLF